MHEWRARGAIYISAWRVRNNPELSMWMAAAEQHPILRRPFSMCFTAAESPATLPPNRPWFDTLTSKGTELAGRNEGF
ncbi:MAG: hypothetical protein ACJ8MH_10400, partial [Povalibacter sp.]